MALGRIRTAEVPVAAADQSIPDSLMVPLAVIVLDVLTGESP